MSLLVKDSKKAKERGTDGSNVNSLVLGGFTVTPDERTAGEERWKQWLKTSGVITCSDESYHWEESAPFGRSLLRGHAGC